MVLLMSACGGDDSGSAAEEPDGTTSTSPVAESPGEQPVEPSPSPPVEPTYSPGDLTAQGVCGAEPVMGERWIVCEKDPVSDQMLVLDAYGQVQYPITSFEYDGPVSWAPMYIEGDLLLTGLDYSTPAQGLNPSVTKTQMVSIDLTDGTIVGGVDIDNAHDAWALWDGIAVGRTRERTAAFNIETGEEIWSKAIGATGPGLQNVQCGPYVLLADDSWARISDGTVTAGPATRFVYGSPLSNGCVVPDFEPDAADFWYPTLDAAPVNLGDVSIDSKVTVGFGPNGFVTSRPFTGHKNDGSMVWTLDENTGRFQSHAGYGPEVTVLANESEELLAVANGEPLDPSLAPFGFTGDVDDLVANNGSVVAILRYDSEPDFERYDFVAM